MKNSLLAFGILSCLAAVSYLLPATAALTSITAEDSGFFNAEGQKL